MTPALRNIGRQYKAVAVPALALVALTVYVTLMIRVGAGAYPLDDAYIVERSVAGILSGHESRFVDSTPWMGVTSPAYVSAIAALALVLPIRVAHWAVSVLSILLLASGLYRLCRRKSLSSGVAFGVALASLIAGFTPNQLFNGLETGLAMAALTWAIITVDHERPPTWGYILLGALYFIRPELAALALICCVQIAAKRPAGWLRGLAISVSTLIIAALLLVWAAGTLTPNTLLAKSYFFAEGCKPFKFKAELTLSGLWEFSRSLGLFAVGFLLTLVSRHRVLVFSFIIIFLSAYFLKYPGALLPNSCRYLYSLLPIAVLGWIECLGHENQQIRRAGRIFGGIAALLALGSLGESLTLYRNDVERFSTDNLAAAEWVEKHVPRNAVVLVHDAGGISLVGEQTLVDLVGLKSPLSVEAHRRVTYPSCGRDHSAIPEIARRSGATYMVVTTYWDHIFHLTHTLRLAGWHVERADRDRGPTYYAVYKIKDPATEGH